MRIPWTKKEKAIVAKYYPNGGWQEVQKHLPHRSKMAIYLQAHKDNVRISEELSIKQHRESGRLGGRSRKEK